MKMVKLSLRTLCYFVAKLLALFHLNDSNGVPDRFIILIL